MVVENGLASFVEGRVDEAAVLCGRSSFLDGKDSGAAVSVGICVGFWLAAEAVAWSSKSVAIWLALARDNRGLAVGGMVVKLFPHGSEYDGSSGSSEGVETDTGSQLCCWR